MISRLFRFSCSDNSLPPERVQACFPVVKYISTFVEQHSNQQIKKKTLVVFVFGFCNMLFVLAYIINIFRHTYFPLLFSLLWRQ